MTITNEQIFEAAIAGKEDIQLRLTKALSDLDKLNLQRVLLTEEIEFFEKKKEEYDIVIAAFGDN